MHSSLLLILFSPLALAFAPNKTTYQKTSTALDAVSRRDALASGVSTLLGVAAVTSLPKQSSAFSQQLEYYQVESSQMRTDGKYDLNSAAVGDYKQLRGMFPHAAGKIASNGPYEKVADIYKIEGLTKNDIKLFKKYQNEFTVNPPGRAFNERINGRVST